MTEVRLGSLVLHDPAVAGTDLVLAFLAFFFAWRVGHRQGRPLFFWLGTGALLGALFHAFFPEQAPTPLGLTVWLLVGVSIGMTAIVLYDLAYRLARKVRLPIPYRLLLYTLFLADLFVLWRVDHEFRVIVAFYAPTLLLFVAASGYRALKEGGKGPWFLFASALVSVAAALIQQEGVSVAAFQLTHNVLYHVVQAVGLVLLYTGFRSLDERLSYVERS